MYAIKDLRDGRVFLDCERGMLRVFERVIDTGTLAKLTKKYQAAIHVLDFKLKT